MKSFAFALSFVSLLGLLPSSASAEVVFDQASQTASHDCGADPEVVISSASGSITLTGACSKVSIEGASNKVSIAQAQRVDVEGSSNEVDIVAADKISVVGSSNQVRWKRGIKSAKAKVSNVGTANKISKTK